MLETMKFYCACCDYGSNNKPNYAKHLQSRKHLDNSTPLMINSNKNGDILKVIQELNNKYDALSEKYDNLNVKYTEIKESNDSLRKLIEYLKNKPSGDTIIGGSGHRVSRDTHIHNYIVNVSVDKTTFENENLSALDGMVKKLIKNRDGSIADVVKCLHFNEKYPENRNIRAEGVKSGMIGIHEATTSGNEWVKKAKKEALEDIAINASQMLRDAAEDETLNICEEDTLKKMTEPIINPNHHGHKKKMKTECRHIEAALRTERSAGRNPDPLFY